MVILHGILNMALQEPWSKKHKSVTAHTPFSLSNSFAEPLSTDELIQLSIARGDEDIVQQYQSHTLGYTPNGGSLDMRQEVAKLYGPEIGAENIVIFPGIQVGLQVASQALLDEKSHAIIFSPSYQSLQAGPIHAGSQVTKIEVTADNGWQIDPRDVEAAVQDNTKYIVINEPQNPTGTLMAKETQAEIKRIAEQNGIYIFSDEVYRLMEHHAEDRLPAMADLYQNGISAVTMAKPWGGCGIMIGWLAMQDLALRQKIIDAQYFSTACPGRASEILAIMALRSSDAILAKNMKIIRHNVQLLTQFVETYSDYFEWVPPSAGAICYIRFKGPLSSEELGRQLAEYGVGMKPAYVFSDDELDSGYFRVGYGEAVFPKALEALTKFVEAKKVDW